MILIQVAKAVCNYSYEDIYFFTKAYEINLLLISKRSASKEIKLRALKGEIHV